MKLITRIRKADHHKKTELWNSADMLRDEAEQLVRDMILSLPGDYKIHDRQYGTNLVDKVYETYGLFPSLFVNEKMMLGMQALYPEKVYASFTLGLDVVSIKK